MSKKYQPGGGLPSRLALAHCMEHVGADPLLNQSSFKFHVPVEEGS